MVTAKGRTDIHRVSRIIPTDYSFVLWYDQGSRPEPGVGIDCEKPYWDFSIGQVVSVGKHAPGGKCCAVALHTIAKVKSADHGGIGSCTVCGAYFRYGEIWRHNETGEHIHIGHECADKYSFVRDRTEWLRYQKQMRAMRKDAATEMKRAHARDKFVKNTPGLESAFKLRNVEQSNDSSQRAQIILRDLYQKLSRYGSLSPKQVQLALKLEAQIRNPQPEPEPEKHIDAPQGRVTFTGIVVSEKVYEGDYGPSTKWTVKMISSEGVWLAWLTMPAEAGRKLYEESQKKYEAWRTRFAEWAETKASQSIDILTYERETGDVAPDTENYTARGRMVTLKATLSRGREPHFAFGKRPTFVMFEKE